MEKKVYTLLYKYWKGDIIPFYYDVKEGIVYFGFYSENETVNSVVVSRIKNRIQDLKEYNEVSYTKETKKKIEDFVFLVDRISNIEEEVFESIIIRIFKEKELLKKGRSLERKDNKGYYSGGGSVHNGVGVIRKPSKKHKNAWKNFIKLFPQYTKRYNELFNNGK